MGDFARGLLFWLLWPPLILVMLVFFGVTFASSVALQGVLDLLRRVEIWTER